MLARISNTPLLIAFFRVFVAVAVFIDSQAALGQTACDADVSRDGLVNAQDLSLVLGAWGNCSNCAADISGDSLVDAVDLSIVLSRWGSPCLAPTIASVSPSAGPLVGGTWVTISGTNLTGATGLTIGGLAATNMVVVNSTTLTAITPAGTAGVKTVSVSTPSGTGSLEGGFTYLALPTISSVSPSSGPVTGGTPITITGTNLLGTTGVTVGSTPATNVSLVNLTTLTAITPAGTAGQRTVSVSTPGGTANLANGFTYVQTLQWATVLEQSPNPAIVSNPSLRAAIIATGYPWRVRDNLTQIEMVLIPPGNFNMGCSPSNYAGCDAGGSENPVHAVTLTNAFYIGRYEVTQAQWTARMGANPSAFQSPSAQVPAAQVPNRPVERVSWAMIAGAGGYLWGTGLRLPSEAEWEYAYRAGTTTAFHGFTGYLNGTNDDSLVGNIAWFNPNSSAQTHPVGGKLGNGFGLYDMSGNVREWVNDWYSMTYYASSPATNPPGPVTGSLRVLRGGIWDDGTEFLRSSGYREALWPDASNGNYGFRVARNP